MIRRKARTRYIGIMVGNLRQRKRVVQNYKKFFPKGIVVYGFVPSSINWANKTIVGLYPTTQGYRIKRFPFPGVVYNRYYGAKPSLVQRIEHMIGAGRCFNQVTRFNKQDVHNLLSQTSLKEHLPKTYSYEAAEVCALLESFPVLYLKPTQGYKGKGVYRLELTATGDVYISEHHIAPLQICRAKERLVDDLGQLVKSKRYIVQQGISTMTFDGHHFDIRVLMQKTADGVWDVTNVISRTAYGGYFNTSVCEDVRPTRDILDTLFPPETVEEVLHTVFKVALQAAQTLEEIGGYHLGEISVDLVIDSDAKVWVIEINGDPQRTIYKGLRTHQRVYQNPMRYARYLLQHGG